MKFTERLYGDTFKRCLGDHKEHAVYSSTIGSYDAKVRTFTYHRPDTASIRSNQMASLDSDEKIKFLKNVQSQDSRIPMAILLNKYPCPARVSHMV